MPREKVESTNGGPDDFQPTQKEVDVGAQLNMSRGELAEACRLFHVKLDVRPAEEIAPDDAEHPALHFATVDSILRQLRIFMSMRVLWALLLEIDENTNGRIEVEEFIRMVAKIRGRVPMSPQFHLRSLPRAVNDHYCKVFDMMADANSMIEREDLVSATKTLNPHVNTNAEAFRQAVDDLNVEDNKYGTHDFLVFQAKLRKQKPEIDVALMSLTEEEEKRFTDLFTEWRSKCQSNANAQELRVALTSLGFSVSLDQCRNRLASLELDGTRAIQLREFLYILVSMGAGTSQKLRPILLPHSSYDTAFSLGFTLEELWELGLDDLTEIKRAGWSVHNVVQANFAEPHQLRQVGYTAAEMRKVGWSAQQLKLAGFSMEELRNSGFSSEALRECCSDLGNHRAIKNNESSGLNLRPVLHSDRPVTADHGVQRWWGTPRIKAMLDPNQNNESIMSIMSF